MTKARTWQEIEEHYFDLNRHGFGHDRMLELVRYIRTSALSNRLFAYTSLDKLVISIYEHIELRRETLEIEFDRKHQRWNFTYTARPYQKPEFVRQYQADSGIAKLHQFVEWIKW